MQLVFSALALAMYLLPFLVLGIVLARQSAMRRELNELRRTEEQRGL